MGIIYLVFHLAVRVSVIIVRASHGGQVAQTKQLIRIEAHLTVPVVGGDDEESVVPGNVVAGFIQKVYGGFDSLVQILRGADLPVEIAGMVGPIDDVPFSVFLKENRSSGRKRGISRRPRCLPGLPRPPFSVDNKNLTYESTPKVFP
jgi:hypothetical protein